MIIALEPRKQYFDPKDAKIGSSLTATITGDGQWIKSKFKNEDGSVPNNYYMPVKINDVEYLIKINSAARKECAKVFQETNTELWPGKQLLIMVVPSSKAKSGKTYAVNPILWEE